MTKTIIVYNKLIDSIDSCTNNTQLTGMLEPVKNFLASETVPSSMGNKLLDFFQMKNNQLHAAKYNGPLLDIFNFKSQEDDGTKHSEISPGANQLGTER